MATALETLQTSLKDKRDLLTKKESLLSTEKNDSGLITNANTKSSLDSMGNRTNCSAKDRDKGYFSWIASNGQVWCDEQSSRTYKAVRDALAAWEGRKNALSGEINTLKREIDTLEQKIKDYVNSPAGKKELDIIQVKEQGNAQVAVTNAQTQLVNAQTQQSQARIEETKSSTKKTIIIVLVIVLILAIAGGIFWYIKKRKSK
jgi:flagellar basal body-associated protein FliL